MITTVSSTLPMRPWVRVFKSRMTVLKETKSSFSAIVRVPNRDGSWITTASFTRNLIPSGACRLERRALSRKESMFACANVIPTRLSKSLSMSMVVAFVLLGTFVTVFLLLRLAFHCVHSLSLQTLLVLFYCSNQDLCMVWRGAHANVGVDPIIFKKCDEVDERNDWSGV